MTNYIFVYNDSGELKTDLITDENFDSKSILKNVESEIFIINNVKYKVVNIYHFINSYIDSETINNKSVLPSILDQNNSILDWNYLFTTISINHGFNLIDEDVKLIILNKIA